MAELRPAAHRDASGILKVPPAGKDRDSPRAALSWQNLSTTDVQNQLHSQHSLGSWALPPVPSTVTAAAPSTARGVWEHQPSPRNEPDPTFKTEEQVSTDNS